MWNRQPLGGRGELDRPPFFESLDGASKVESQSEAAALAEFDVRRSDEPPPDLVAVADCSPHAVIRVREMTHEANGVSVDELAEALGLLGHGLIVPASPHRALDIARVSPDGRSQARRERGYGSHSISWYEKTVRNPSRS